MASEAARQDAGGGDGWRLAALVARVIVGGLFIATGVIKVVDPSGFAKEIQGYELAPIMITNALAIVVPWVEIVAGTFLVFALWRAEARLLVAVMLVAFTFVKIYAWTQGKTGSCGCGGDVAALNLLLDNPQGIFTNLGLLVLLGVDYAAVRRSSGARSRAVDQPPQVAGAQSS